jgi:hypothetical protein
MRKVTSVLLLYISLAVGVLCQELSRTPKLELAWKGNVIDLTTAEQILTKYGKPEKDSTSGFEVLTVNQTFTKEIKKKNWRVIRYKTLIAVENIEDVKFALARMANLYFCSSSQARRRMSKAF